MLTTHSELLEKIRLGEDSFLELKEVRFAGSKVRGPCQQRQRCAGAGRGGQKPGCVSTSERLSGKRPEYRLLDDSGLLLTIHAASEEQKT